MYVSQEPTGESRPASLLPENIEDVRGRQAFTYFESIFGVLRFRLGYAAYHSGIISTSLVMDQPRRPLFQANTWAEHSYSDLPQGQIRLLVISVAPDGALQLSLAHYMYDTELAYDTLSYAWPRAGSPRTFVLCDGARLYLSFELLEALKSLAVLNPARPVWIDYICIDQNNADEKAWQVKLMGKYYAQAERVWCWLGPSDALGGLAVKTMHRLATKLRRLELSQPITSAWLAESGLPAMYDRLWDSLDDFYTREWFNRLWTMQEFTLAKKAIFVCGPHTVAGSDVACVADQSLRLGLTTLTRRGRIPGVGYKDGYHFTVFASRYWEARGEHGGVPLALAMQLGRYKEAKGSNPQDRVYALLGLLDSKVTAQIKVNYQLPYWDMYVEVDKLSLKTSSHLEWLAQCESTSRAEGLPSWCADFSSENKAAPFSYSSYFAGFESGRDGSPCFEFSTHSNHLHVKGVSVTTIEYVAKYWEKWDTNRRANDGPQEKFAYTSRWMDDCFEQAQIILAKPASTLLEAFQRTLIADILRDQAPQSKEHLQEMWTSAQLLFARFREDNTTVPLSAEQQKLSGDFLDAVFHACRFRRFFVTADLCMALGPDEVRVGDQVVVFQNACMPFIVRKVADGEAYKLLGPAYVRGLMMGQVFGLVNDDRWRMFEIA